MSKRRPVIFVQVSHELTAPHNPALEYYRKVYQEQPGYFMPEHFMEIPEWVAVIDGMLSDEHYDTYFHVITDVEFSTRYLAQMSPDVYVLASVMDVNREIIQQVINRSRQRFIVSGYVDSMEFLHGTDREVQWLDDVSDLVSVLPHVNVDASPDYSLFQGISTIPRLTLSEGCLYNCAFCTISREVTERTWENVIAQVESFKQLTFELVYLNDKTFGQAKNWRWLSQVYNLIREFNPTFHGFIIQTTVTDALKHFGEWLDIPIRYIEVGVEHVDDEYLERMRKPYRMVHLKDLCHRVRKNPIGFIPNIMFALPDAQYGSTLIWVCANSDIISFINPFVLTAYHSSKGDLVSARQPSDSDENQMEKSWLSDWEVEQSWNAWRIITNVTS